MSASSGEVVAGRILSVASSVGIAGPILQQECERDDADDTDPAGSKIISVRFGGTA
jgi:hypothetical protein